jgi:uncharacterized protein GlcG (DUF336 family)
MSLKRLLIVLATFAVSSAFILAQAPAAPAAAPAPAPNYTLTPYGPPISLEVAKKVAVAARAEAARNHWLMTVAVVSPSGDLIYYEHTDNSQWGSAKVAIDKARSAALFKRPTKVYQDQLAQGGPNTRILQIEGVTAVEGGVPLISDGKIIGAIGVSGDTSSNDGQCANAAAQTVK